MSYDFSLSDRGDILFETMTKEEREPFVFNFHYATSPSLLVNFYCGTNDLLERKPGWLQFNFNTYTVNNDKNNKLVSGNDFIRQMIKIQLETEIGTLRENKDVGSELYKYYHGLINPQETESVIKELVKEAIKDILPDAIVTVHLQKTAYFDFYNAVKISITFENKVMWFTI